MAQVRLHPDWLARLGPVFDQPQMRALKAFLAAQRAAGRTLYPPPPQWFAALDATPPQAVRAVILGQDPYHGPGQAHGLAFSVPPGVPVPPSLANVFRALQADLGLPPPGHGHLARWASQGVLLLNTVLTVAAGQAGAHRGQGWEYFTDAVITSIAADNPPTAFLLWGSDAQRKATAIPALGPGTRHLVLRAPHPSPLSAHRGFLGCRHFSQTNAFLERAGRGAIDWRLGENLP